MLAGHFEAEFAVGQFFFHLLRHGFGLGAAEGADVLHIVGADDVVDRQMRDFEVVGAAGFVGNAAAFRAARGGVDEF